MESQNSLDQYHLYMLPTYQINDSTLPKYQSNI